LCDECVLNFCKEHFAKLIWTFAIWGLIIEYIDVSGVLQQVDDNIEPLSQGSDVENVYSILILNLRVSTTFNKQLY
jgi:hypothetical protein